MIVAPVLAVVHNIGDEVLPFWPFLIATVVKMIVVFTVYMVGVALLTLAERKISVATPENNRSSIVSFYIRKSAAEATRILDAERVKVSPQALERPDAAAASGFPTRVRVAFAFFNTAADVDRMLRVAEKL